MKHLATHGSARSRQLGLTAIEAMVATAVFCGVILCMFSIATEVFAFVSNSEGELAVQAETNRAFVRLSQLLRRTGWNDAAGASYPQVAGKGAELEFRLLTDFDGNGYSFDLASGEIEWHDKVYAIRLDPDTGMLAVYDGATEIWTLARHIRRVEFTTFREDNRLDYKEIRIALDAQKQNPDGTISRFSTTGSVHMRN